VKNLKRRNVEIREKIIQVLRDNGGKLATAEVADKTGIPVNKVRYYLSALASEGKLKREFKGRAIIVWSLREDV